MNLVNEVFQKNKKSKNKQILKCNFNLFFPRFLIELLIFLYIDMMYIHQDSGLINISYYKFDVDDVSGKLDSNRPVPFRMTPNITEFVTPVGVNGPLTSSMISAARYVLNKMSITTIFCHKHFKP